MFRHGIVHGVELSLVDLDILGAIFLLCLRLCESNGANLRVREDYRRYVVIVKLGLGECWTTKETVGQATAGSDGD